MGGSLTNRRRIGIALACRPGLDCLPVLPWGLDALAEPLDPSFAPLWKVLLERAVIKRRWIGAPDFFAPAPPVEREDVTPAIEGGKVQVSHLHGPGGRLSQEVKSIPGTSASETTSRYLKSPEDVELYLSWPYREAVGDVAPYFELERSVGEQGVVTYRMTDALGVAAQNFEPEPFALCSVEQEDVILRLLEVIAGRIYRYVQGVLEAGARPIFNIGGCEFATPPLLGKRFFDDYVVRFDQPLFALIHRYGCKVIVHCHGRVNGLLESFVDMGVDALHPLETPPMGDVTLAEAKRRVGNRLCFVGNIQIGDMMSATPEEIREQVRRIRRDAPTGMILSTSATPYETPMSVRLLENYIAAIEAAA
jgi:Uroporphyrinogen decarboxylase (URO-D)